MAAVQFSWLHAFWSHEADKGEENEMAGPAVG